MAHAAIPLFFAAAFAASFDVASIKPTAIPIGREGGNRTHVEFTPTSLSMLNVNLEQCVEWAYGVHTFQIADGHPLPASYDILAKTAAPVDAAQLKAMLQELLALRFHLAVHRESRMLPVYELTVMRAKLPPPKDEGQVRAADSLPRVEGGSFVFYDATLPHFAEMLSQLRGVDLPVVDRTGIAGTYDLILKGAPDAAREGDGTALFRIVEDQLGLKLQPAKAPFDVIVIDHAEKPSGN